MLLTGLAPAAHGGNRTGRVFTGDKSADFLIKCLYKTGITNQQKSEFLSDGLKMNDAFMTPVLKCVPPNVKTTAEELRNCSQYFARIDLNILDIVKLLRIENKNNYAFQR